MPIKVFYRNQENQPCTIRPTPFVQISENVLKNKEGSFGVTYNITLTGTLLAKHGTPYAVDPAKAISSPLFDYLSNYFTCLIGRRSSSPFSSCNPILNLEGNSKFFNSI